VWNIGDVEACASPIKAQVKPNLFYQNILSNYSMDFNNTTY